MANLAHKLKKIEERIGMRRKPDMGMPLMFSYDEETRELFTSDDEQRSYMDWRLQQVRDERIRAGDYLPIPLYALVGDDHMRDHIEEFRTSGAGNAEESLAGPKEGLCTTRLDSPRPGGTLPP